MTAWVTGTGVVVVGGPATALAPPQPEMNGAARVEAASFSVSRLEEEMDGTGCMRWVCGLSLDRNY